MIVALVAIPAIFIFSSKKGTENNIIEIQNNHPFIVVSLRHPFTQSNLNTFIPNFSQREIRINLEIKDKAQFETVNRLTPDGREVPYMGYSSSVNNNLISIKIYLNNDGIQVLNLSDQKLSEDLELELYKAILGANTREINSINESVFYNETEADIENNTRLAVSWLAYSISLYHQNLFNIKRQ